ncbi:ATP-dependent zinc metalloprotease FtsH [Candidatus Peregrinibacteria bacterium]|nr:ATP-dependent zinc metalloprotease FtsH [Candidatus Peregrinibacteria bacterium]
MPPQPPHQHPQFQPPRRSNSLGYVLLIALILTVVYYLFNPQGATEDKRAEEIPISQMVAYYQDQRFSELEIKNSKIYATDKNKKTYYAVRPEGESLKDLGFSDPENPTEIKAISTEAAAFWLNVISGWLPIILFIALIVFMAKQLGKGANSAFSFGKSQARVYSGNGKKKTTFKDVAGMEESKEELVEVVDFLKNPKKYTKMGAKIPRGVMLVGAPGTGKTLLARAVAGEANVPFFSISGSEFVEMFVGVGASRVRDLFQKAKRNAPCIIFIDEIDAVGRQRGFGLGGGHDEREQTLNQILTEMDGFEKETNVIVMAATNRPDILDVALTRPGRFDRRVIIDMPNLNEREDILKVHVRDKPMDKKTDLRKIAQQTPGFSGADLENLVNEAALLAGKKNRKSVSQQDLEMAVEKVGLGPEKKSRRLSEEEKKITAYHEVGHALVGKLLPKCDPIHKVTIIPRGMALGVTWAMPEEDVHLKSVSKFKDEICSLLGGYVAEKVFFGEVTTGASSDLQRATTIARAMVTDYGMSPELGLMIFGDKSTGNFMGTDVGFSKNYSEEMAAKIDEAIGKIIKEAEQRTTKLIEGNKPLMDKIAAALLKKEVLNKEEFDKFFSKTKKAKK